MCFRICFLFWNKCSYLFEVSSFVVIASQGAIIITASILPKNMQISYEESEQGKKQWSKERNCKSWSDYLGFKKNYISIQIILSYVNVCITAKKFMCSHFCKSPWLIGWWHIWLHIDKAYRVKISPKTQVTCTCRLLVISSIITWIVS